MNREQWGALLDQWGTTAVILATLSGMALAWWQANHSRRAGVSAHEHEARQDELAERRDTIADRDALIAQKDRDIAQLVQDRDRWMRIAEEYERLHDEDRSVRMVHGAWDYTTYEAAYRADLPVTPPPPLIAPRSPREE